MHFFVLGGNGRTGSIIVDEAVSRSHTVTALVRDPSKLTPKFGVTYVKGASNNASDLVNAFSTAFERKPIDAVIVALNAPRATDSPFSKSISPPRLMADSVQNATAAMKRFNVKRIIVMQASGVGNSFKNLNFLMRLILTYSEMSKQFKDHSAVDLELRETAKAQELEWIMVRPAMLKGEGFLPIKHLGEDGKGQSFMPQISRESVARFIVQDCAEGDEYVGKTPVICN